MPKLAKLLAVSLLALPVVANSTPWRELGAHAKLLDALIACTDTDSDACVPYLAGAVAVGALLNDQANIASLGRRDKSRTDDDRVDIVFYGAQVTRCSVNWLQSLNGQTLLHSALGLPVTFAESKNIYWTDALRRAAISLCHT